MTDHQPTSHKCRHSTHFASAKLAFHRTQCASLGANARGKCACLLAMRVPLLLPLLNAKKRAPASLSPRSSSYDNLEDDQR